METTQKHSTRRGEIKNARQSSSSGLIIREKEKVNLATMWLSHPFHQTRCSHDRLLPLDLTNE
jgi:hypothetical protein